MSNKPENIDDIWDEIDEFFDAVEEKPEVPGVPQKHTGGFALKLDDFLNKEMNHDAT